MKKIYMIIIFTVTLYSDPSFSVIPDVKIDNIDKYYLGKRLFFDPNLSSDKKVSCATCHNINLYGTDKKEHFIGANNIEGELNSPTIYNAKFNIAQDSAGEASTIEDRSSKSFLSKIEMNGNINKTILYIHNDKVLFQEFTDLYGFVSRENIFDSIAYFVKNLLSPNSKFDKFLKGDNTILNNDEKKGYLLFKEYGCVSCHNGINLGGNMYQKLGIFNELKHVDDTSLGRYRVTKNELDKNVFKVPSLRNIEKTAPYFHDGSIKDLKTAIKEMGILQLGVKLPSEDIFLIEKFLATLTGDLANE